MTVADKIPVIDLFAGPGGLGEGFSAYTPDEIEFPFRIGLSVEKDPVARETLRLRSFFRQFHRDDVPEVYYRMLRCEFDRKEFPDRLQDEGPDLLRKWQAADDEAMRAEMGASDEINREISSRINKVLGPKPGMWVLIGGPPCQAYSIVGRVRNQGNAAYRIEDDHRSNLYREYLRIIAQHRPPIFVMENVKGMLSASLEGQKVFDRILNDLKSPTRHGDRESCSWHCHDFLVINCTNSQRCRVQSAVYRCSLA